MNASVNRAPHFIRRSNGILFVKLRKDFIFADNNSLRLTAIHTPKDVHAGPQDRQTPIRRQGNLQDLVGNIHNS